MRIAQVSPFFLPVVGGIEYYVASLSRKLVEGGHQVRVLTSNVPRTVKYQVDNGIGICRFTSLFGPWDNQFTPGLFFKLVGGGRADIVHFHNHLYFCDNMAALSKLFTHSPLVLTSHGSIPGYRGWRKAVEVFYQRTVGRWTLQAADRVIALAPKQAEILAWLGAKPERITVIPPGVDLESLRANADSTWFRERYGLKDRQLILFVGSLIPRKGVEYFIEATRYLKSGPAVLIVGDELPSYPGYRKALEERARALGKEAEILFLGGLPREALGSAYQVCDLFVLPSLSEGLPLVLLEAMGLGKCALASDIPGNSDIIRDGENGLLFPPRDAAGLARKVDLALSDDQLRRKLAVRARQDINEGFSWDAVTQRVLEVYREVTR